MGTRPQLVKAACVSKHLRELGPAAPYEEVVVHTGQHYDDLMSDVFVRDLELPIARELGVGSARLSTQLARVLVAVDEVLEEERPDTLLVYGDTVSTLGAALAADAREIPVTHAEAGERIFRRFRVPEEAHRILVDQLSSLCLCATRTAVRYLRREALAHDRIRFVGDPMYDLFLWASERVHERAAISPADLGVEEGAYHLATIHRVENTVPGRLVELLETLDRSRLPVVLPLHPRVRDTLASSEWRPSGSLRMLEPLGYYDFLRLLLACDHCVTDSGGVIREAFFAARPTVVPMETSWWPQSTYSGWSVNVGRDGEALLVALEAPPPDEPPWTAEFGDGRAAERIVAAVASDGARSRDEVAWHRHGVAARLTRPAATTFTHAGYRRLLDGLLERGYGFAAFPEAEEKLRDERPFALLRHDIDLELEQALTLARVDAEAGVRATFFFMLGSGHYSVLSATGTRMVREILELGHGLGLHLDAGALAGDVAGVAGECAREAALLEERFARPVEAVSFHRPSREVIEAGPEATAPRPHTYLPLFRETIRYFSDSRGTWAHGHPLESPEVAAGRPIQILVHPIWWNEDPVGPYESLARFVDRRVEALEGSVAANCEVYRVGALAGAGGMAS